MLTKSHKRMRRLRPTIYVGLMLLATASLGACGTTKLPASVAGLCNVIPKAEYAVLGKTPYDQDFVDAAVIAGDSCGYEPPKPRPPELDKPAPGSVTPIPAPAPARKPSRWQRLKGRVTGKPVAGTVDPMPSRIVVPASLPQIGQPLPDPDPTPAVAEPAPQPPRSPVERLLDPDGRRS